MEKEEAEMLVAGGRGFGLRNSVPEKDVIVLMFVRQNIFSVCSSKHTS